MKVMVCVARTAAPSTGRCRTGCRSARRARAPGSAARWRTRPASRSRLRPGAPGRCRTGRRSTRPQAPVGQFLRTLRDVNAEELLLQKIRPRCGRRRRCCRGRRGPGRPLPSSQTSFTASSAAAAPARSMSGSARRRPPRCGGCRPWGRSGLGHGQSLLELVGDHDLHAAQVGVGILRLRPRRGSAFASASVLPAYAATKPALRLTLV